MAIFEDAIEYVLANEGVESDNPKDRGGKTRYGISARTAERHGLKPEEISPTKAMEIIRADYWLFGVLANQRLATKLLDFALPADPYDSVRALQRALNRVMPRDAAPLKVDGVLGPKTIAAADLACARNEKEVLMALCCEQCRHFARVGQDPSQREFLAGWIFRALRLPS